jgi:hypothetical protein
MPHHAMALVAASLLFTTQCYAAVKLNTSRSNIYRAGSTTSGGGAGVTTVHGSKSNSSYRMGGGGGGRVNDPPRGGQGMDYPGRR